MSRLTPAYCSPTHLLTYSPLLALETSDHGNDPSNGPGDVSRARHQGGRPALHGFPRHLATLHDPRLEARRRSVRRRPRLRRLQHPRLAGDQRERHAPHAAGRHGVRRSVHRDPDAVHDLQRAGPDHARRLHARPAQRRPQGGELPEEHRRRRHLLHRPRSRVLHLRRRPLRPDAQQRLLLPRQRRRPMEPRQGLFAAGQNQPRLQAASQGRLLPRAAGRRPDGHPQRDDASR